jgi:hypothetical protein
MPGHSVDAMARPKLPGFTKIVVTNFTEVFEADAFRVPFHRSQDVIY